MSSQAYVPYRGYRIEVHVTPVAKRQIGGVARRYRVSWEVSSLQYPMQRVVSFPEQFDFISEQQAFKYGESRAHTYIDSMECTRTARRQAG
ncbi:hypothetical protein B0G74_6767 [Paraburkholderia sp. BL9I2N2]|jgi:hypothetical protein|nr:hypothetical protein B0G74_6767 [Paraburkholderia sp. BL9I2N2]